MDVFEAQRGVASGCVCACMHNITSGHEQFLEAMLPRSSFSWKMEDLEFGFFTRFLLCSLLASSCFKLNNEEHDSLSIGM